MRSYPCIQPPRHPTGVKSGKNSPDHPQRKQSQACASAAIIRYRTFAEDLNFVRRSLFVAAVTGADPRTFSFAAHRIGSDSFAACAASAAKKLTKLAASSTLPRLSWGHSSAGRALQWHCRGHRFDPDWLHHRFCSSLVVLAHGFFASPSSRGPGHRPFTAVTGVRIPLGTPPSSRQGQPSRWPCLFLLGHCDLMKFRATERGCEAAPQVTGARLDQTKSPFPRG